MTHIQQRRDPAAIWAATNPVLYEGEVGWESDNKRGKLGDGVTAWNDLPYLNITPPVVSVAGKVGAVSLIVADVSGAAPSASPVFTGNPTAPTPLAADNDDSIATTKFVKDQAYAPLASPALTGNPTAPTPTAGDNDTSIATTAFVKAAIDAAITAAKLALHPVGSLYFTETNINPGTFIGGTWTTYGDGRVLVGRDTGQTEFDTAGETGGFKAVTLTAAQSGLREHYHTYPAAPTPGSLDFADGPARGNGVKDNGFKTGGVNTTSAYGTGVAGAQDATQSHTNLQPYIVGFMWKRTA